MAHDFARFALEKPCTSNLRDENIARLHDYLETILEPKMENPIKMGLSFAKMETVCLALIWAADGGARDANQPTGNWCDG